MHTLYFTIFIVGIVTTGLFLLTSLVGGVGHDHKMPRAGE